MFCLSYFFWLSMLLPSIFPVLFVLLVLLSIVVFEYPLLYVFVFLVAKGFPFDYSFLMKLMNSFTYSCIFLKITDINTSLLRFMPLLTSNLRIFSIFSLKLLFIQNTMYYRGTFTTQWPWQWKLPNLLTFIVVTKLTQPLSCCCCWGVPFYSNIFSPLWYF